MADKLRSHRDLEVYRAAFEAANAVFEHSKRFPKEETYSLTDQIRRSFRSVTANLAEAWRRRRYEAAFINKLNESEAEAAETQVWIEHAVRCGYLSRTDAAPIYRAYESILKMLVVMSRQPEKWTIKGQGPAASSPKV
jgi:four helix bundle protein